MDILHNHGHNILELYKFRFNTSKEVHLAKKIVNGVVKGVVNSQRSCQSTKDLISNNFKLVI